MNLVLPCTCVQKEEDEEDQAHLHKPRDNKLYQQKLKPCCLLVITTQKVVTLFVLTGLIFLPIGITLLVQSTEIYQQDVDYTDCYSSDETGKQCSDEYYIGKTCQCKIKVDIEIPDTVKGEIMFLYGLNNYYQNHRLYRQSQSFLQLMGNIDGACYVKEYCDPYNQDKVQGREVTYYPKGAVANSYFTDTFKLKNVTEDKNAAGDRYVDLVTTDISWKSDRESKFLLPKNWKNWKPDSDEFLMPKDWGTWTSENGTEKILPADITDEHLINWMNPAAFPSFTKLYAKVKLDPGRYKLEVSYRYRVHDFHGEKFVRLAETSWMGGRSLFLGSAYCIVGFFCLVAAVFFGIISRKTRAKRHERKKKIDEQLVHYKDQNNHAHSTL